MKKIILALSVLFTTNAMAYHVASGTVGVINTNPNSVLIEFANGNEDSCSNSAAAGNLILPLTSDTKAQFSVLLSAAVSKKTARILYDGCLAGIPQIIRVDLMP